MKTLPVAKTTSFEDKCRQAVCRVCQRRGLLPILDLGRMPASDGLLTEQQLQTPEPRYPLEVAFCPDCTLVQILETVDPEVLFCGNYLYFSSFSQTLLEHSRRNVLSLIEKKGLNAQSFVIELASNDGYLLKNYVEYGIPVLGIDPATEPAKAAEEAGIPTLCTFFTLPLARRLVSEGKQADVIHANNVLAHVADTNGFVEGLQLVLKPGGTAVIEVPYIGDLLAQCEFDTIYHEHLCYFSVSALDHLFRRHGLYLNDIQRLSIHGGSLRLYVEPHEQVQDTVRRLLDREKEQGLDTHDAYLDFADRVEGIRTHMQALLRKVTQQGHRVAAYGAAAKGTILLNYIGSEARLIEFVVDRNTHKHGKYMPGVHLQVCDPQRLQQEQPDYVVLLPWNFKDEILAQQETYRRQGGKFIIPIPEPVVV